MKSEWFSDAAWILALCLGLASCQIADHYNAKLDAETALIKAQVPK